MSVTDDPIKLLGSIVIFIFLGVFIVILVNIATTLVYMTIGIRSCLSCMFYPCKRAKTSDLV